MAESFSEGVAEFIIGIFDYAKKGQIAQETLEEMLHFLPSNVDRSQSNAPLPW